jgi:hypothetical protein
MHKKYCRGKETKEIVGVLNIIICQGKKCACLVIREKLNDTVMIFNIYCFIILIIMEHVVREMLFIVL